MKKNIKVSIVTPCFNSEKTIRDTIEHVLNQTYKNIEYIIVDGGSTDSTMSIVKEYEPLFHGRMKWVSEKDKGIYNAMNKGIKMSTGQLIGITNSDDYYELDAVENAVNAITDDKHQVIYGYVNIIKKNRKYCIATESHIRLKNAMIPHPSCFIMRRTYQKYGLYLEWYKVSADYELMLRLYKNKVQFTQIKKVLSNCRFGGVSCNHKYDFENDIARAMHGICKTDGLCERIINFLQI